LQELQEQQELRVRPVQRPRLLQGLLGLQPEEQQPEEQQPEEQLVRLRERAQGLQEPQVQERALRVLAGQPVLPLERAQVPVQSPVRLRVERLLLEELQVARVEQALPPG
jgi:hypothetical protein